MKKIILITMLMGAIFAQEQDLRGSNTAVIEFQSSGINDMTNQALFNYFLEELDNATENTFMDQKIIEEKIQKLELKTNNCFSDECIESALNKTGADLLIAGTLQFVKNKYKVNIKKLDPTKKNKPKTYSIRYKGEPDGFITELQILAWEIMDKNPPGSLTVKRKSSKESFLQNPTNKRVLVLTIAGLAASSYLLNKKGYDKSMKGANNDREIFRDDHISSANKSKNEANLSLVVMLATLGYAYYDGLLNFGDNSR
ncbi:MAG: hypothetical protein ACKVHG_09530 [Sphingomonadales bacterium]|jgi:hypothetical protein